MSSLKTRIKEYITSSIDDADYGVIGNDATTKEKLQFIADNFTNEAFCPNNLKRFGSKQEIVNNHLKKLPSYLNIDFENHTILQIGKDWGFTLDTEKKEGYFLANWWDIIAQNIFELFRTHKIDI